MTDVGKLFVANGGFSWDDKQLTISYALESELKEIGDKHYCPDCYEFDDELDEYVPKKKGANNG